MHILITSNASQCLSVDEFFDKFNFQATLTVSTKPTSFASRKSNILTSFTYSSHEDPVFLASKSKTTIFPARTSNILTSTESSLSSISQTTMTTHLLLRLGVFLKSLIQVKQNIFAISRKSTSALMTIRPTTQTTDATSLS
jgi:hypothetical protein